MTITDHRELVGQTTGAVLTPGDQGYDDARHVWNARFADRSPEIIVRAERADDVAAAIRWARQHDMRLSVKGGGHSYAGHSAADDGLLIDLSPMRGVKVRADERVATVQAGATWAEVDAATQHHGLATTGVTVSSVGVAGSTLGGGTGWLSRLHGNSLDNLLAVEVVTADGDIVQASERENAELFWGVRGAGANLGVVTSFEFQLHPVGPSVLAGQIVYPFDDAERLMRVYREFMNAAPDEVQCLPFTFRVPPIDPFPEAHHGQPALDFVVFHTDPTAVDAFADLQGLAEPILEGVGAMPYVDAQQAFDPNLPAGARYYSKGHDLASLPDAAIDTFCANVRNMRGALTATYLEPRGGAVGRTGPDDTAAGGRTAPYSFHIIAGWTEPDEDEDVMAWAQRFQDDMAPFSTGGVYVNLLAEDEKHRVETAYSDVARLRDLKRRWDPDNVFCGNANVTPAS